MCPMVARLRYMYGSTHVSLNVECRVKMYVRECSWDGDPILSNKGKMAILLTLSLFNPPDGSQWVVLP